MSNKTAKRADEFIARERHWRRLIAQQRRSGLSQAAFCRRRRILPGTFAWWTSELRRRDERRRRGGIRLGADNVKPFIPVRVVARQSAAAGMSSTAVGFEIELRTGRRIRVAAEFNRDALRDLVLILDSEEATTTC
jgi:hypothetical protein